MSFPVLGYVIIVESNDDIKEDQFVVLDWSKGGAPFRRSNLPSKNSERIEIIFDTSERATQIIESCSTDEIYWYTKDWGEMRVFPLVLGSPLTGALRN